MLRKPATGNDFDGGLSVISAHFVIATVTLIAMTAAGLGRLAVKGMVRVTPQMLCNDGLNTGHVLFRILSHEFTPISTPTDRELAVRELAVIVLLDPGANHHFSMGQRRRRTSVSVPPLSRSYQ